MQKEWLGDETTVEEAERVSLESIRAQNEKEGGNRIPDVPCGFGHDEWVEFKGKMQPGDRLFRFKSPPETWVQLAGREGYSIVRDGEIVANRLTVFS